MSLIFMFEERKHCPALWRLLMLTINVDKHDSCWAAMFYFPLLVKQLPT